MWAGRQGRIRRTHTLPRSEMESEETVGAVIEASDSLWRVASVFQAFEERRSHMGRLGLVVVPTSSSAAF